VIEQTTAWEWAGLSLAAATAAAMNAVAGGGTFWQFPLLMAAGLDAKTANATNCFVLWIGSLTAAGGYWHRRPKAPGVVAPLVAVSLVGALLGAVLLLVIPARDFRAAVPWLLLFATLTFAFGPAVARRARWEGLHHHKGISLAGLLLAQLLVSIYGGFFGAGIGVLMLAVFGAAGMTDIHEMNSLKASLATLINGAAAVAFVVAQQIAWQGYFLAIAAAVGGYTASRVALRTKPEWVRRFALTVAVVVTIYYFVFDEGVKG
jgi:uncharacterized membrane protein YfcA